MQYSEEGGGEGRPRGKKKGKNRRSLVQELTERATVALGGADKKGDGKKQKGRVSVGGLYLQNGRGGVEGKEGAGVSSTSERGFQIVTEGILRKAMLHESNEKDQVLHFAGRKPAGRV